MSAPSTSDALKAPEAGARGSLFSPCGGEKLDVPLRLAGEESRDARKVLSNEGSSFEGLIYGVQNSALDHSASSSLNATIHECRLLAKGGETRRAFSNLVEALQRRNIAKRDASEASAPKTASKKLSFHEENSEQQRALANFDFFSAELPPPPPPQKNLCEKSAEAPSGAAAEKTRKLDAMCGMTFSQGSCTEEGVSLAFDEMELLSHIQDVVQRSGEGDDRESGKFLSQTCDKLVRDVTAAEKKAAEVLNEELKPYLLKYAKIGSSACECLQRARSMRSEPLLLADVHTRFKEICAEVHEVNSVFSRMSGKARNEKQRKVLGAVFTHCNSLIGAVGKKLDFMVGNGTDGADQAGAKKRARR